MVSSAHVPWDTLVTDVKRTLMTASLQHVLTADFAVTGFGVSLVTAQLDILAYVVKTISTNVLPTHVLL